MLLLCLVCSVKCYSQQCLYFKYDKSGNRIESYEGNCGSEYKYQTRELANNEEISESEEQQELSVYPNPNNGIFRIMINNDDDLSAVYQIYDNKGVLVKTDNYVGNQEIDISNNPAGVYLLRIIKGESVCSKVVVKL